MVLNSSSRDVIDKQECAIIDQGKATAKSTLLLFDDLVLDRHILSFTIVQKKFSQREA